MCIPFGEIQCGSDVRRAVSCIAIPLCKTQRLYLSSSCKDTCLFPQKRQLLFGRTAASAAPAPSSPYRKLERIPLVSLLLAFHLLRLCCRFSARPTSTSYNSPARVTTEGYTTPLEYSLDFCYLCSGEAWLLVYKNERQPGGQKRPILCHAQRRYI